MFFYKDIREIIVSFLNNIDDLFSWRHICSDTLNDIQTPNFICIDTWPCFYVTKLILHKYSTI